MRFMIRNSLNRAGILQLQTAKNLLLVKRHEKIGFYQVTWRIAQSGTRVCILSVLPFVTGSSEKSAWIFAFQLKVQATCANIVHILKNVHSVVRVDLLAD